MTTAASPPLPTVASWSMPTMVQTGRGFLSKWLRISQVGSVVLVTDADLVDNAATVAAATTNRAVGAVVARTADDSDQEVVRRVLSALAEKPSPVSLLAVGGGGVLDVARIAAVAHASPSARGYVLSDRTESGVMFLPSDPQSACDVVCVPSNFGTAAEVSPIAMLRQGAAQTMVVSPGLRARLAGYDPAVTESLSLEQRVAGLVEPLSRVLVPAVLGKALPLNDRLATALISTCRDLTNTTAESSDVWLESAALTSAATHTCFLAMGRPPFGHSLWPLATEMMPSFGLTKPVALALLLPAWAEALAGGDLSAAWGSSARFAEVVGQAPGEWAQEWRTRWQVIRDHGEQPGAQPVAIRSVAEAVWHNWFTGGFFNPEATQGEVAGLLERATAGLTAAG